MQRNTQTQDKIKKAFIKLMKAKGFELLTVSDITTAAKINRSTFYAHYDDKYDLLQCYEESVLKSLGQTLNDNLNTFNKDNAYPVIRLVIDYIESEFELIKVLMTIGSFEKKIKGIFRQIVDNGFYLDKGNTKNVDVIPKDYAYEIITSALLDTIKYWLSKSKPESKKRIVDIIMKTRYLSPYDLLGVDEQFGNAIKV